MSVLTYGKCLFIFVRHIKSPAPPCTPRPCSCHVSIPLWRCSADSAQIPPRTVSVTDAHVQSQTSPRPAEHCMANTLQLENHLHLKGTSSRSQSLSGVRSAEQVWHLHFLAQGQVEGWPRLQLEKPSHLPPVPSEMYRTM